MNRSELIELIRRKKSFLCIGLDTDISKIPAFLLDYEDPVYEFNRRIIDATHSLAVAYKPNFAFYESSGLKGWQSLSRTIQYLNTAFHGEVFTIADAKRGDIGNTSHQYAKAVFSPEASGLDFDAVTVAPYMGEDSVSPFLSYPGKWVILLALTSNKGAEDFQLTTSDGRPLFEQVLERSKRWGNEENMMYVTGATQACMLTRIRSMVPGNFLLVPGVGAQGGSLKEVAEFGMIRDCGLIVNSSRNIINASRDIDFAEKAFTEASRMQQEMKVILKSIGF